MEININISKKKENSFKEEVKVFQSQTALLPILLELQSGQVNSVTPTTYSQKLLARHCLYYISIQNNWHIHSSRAYVCIKAVYFAIMGL